MRRLIFATVFACVMSCGSAVAVPANTGGGLIVSGVSLHETPENYLRTIKYLTVSPANHSHPSFHSTDVQVVRSIEDPLRRQIYQAMAFNRSDRFQFSTARRAQENFTMRVAAVHYMVRMGMKVS